MESKSESHFYIKSSFADLLYFNFYSLFKCDKAIIFVSYFFWRMWLLNSIHFAILFIRFPLILIECSYMLFSSIWDKANVFFCILKYEWSQCSVSKYTRANYFKAVLTEITLWCKRCSQYNAIIVQCYKSRYLKTKKYV